MAKTLGDVRYDTLMRLGDTAQKVWSSEEIDLYIQRGYDDLCRRTKCLWTWQWLEDSEPYTGTHNGDWEVEYLDYIENRFNRTEIWEDAYIDAEPPTEPANHTSAWEWRLDYVDGHIVGTVDLPPDLIDIERITWDSEALDPATSIHMESVDYLYKTETGDQPYYYMWDQDGIHKLRRYPIPTTTGYTDVTGTWGIPRGLDADFTAEVEVGTWGIPRSIPAGFTALGTWGIPRHYPSQSGNTKIEYIRRGRDLESAVTEFELPNHYVRYVRHFAMAMALERESPGQDLKLAAHYAARYRIGVERMKRRKSRLYSSGLRRLGGPVKVRNPLAAPRLPWNYGRTIRTR